MLLSQMDQNRLHELTDDQMDRIVFDNCVCDEVSASAAILLGGIPAVLRERTQAAAQLYLSGKVPYIIPTGGVAWDTEFGRMTEAECMTLLLKEYGVPEDAILIENQATTTRENMLYASVLMERTLHLRGKYRVYIVTSPTHLRRSMALAKLYLPRTAQLSSCPGVCPAGMPGVWMNDDFQRQRVFREVELLKSTIDAGDIEDIEF